MGNIQLGVAWQAINTIDDGKIIIYNDNNDGIDTNDSILATIQLLGTKGLLTLANAKNTGVYTGIPDGTRDINGDGTPDKYTYHGSDYNDYPYHEVDLTNTFTSDGEALFDYLFVFAETTPLTGTNITKPEGSTLVGSNARTPYYIYKKQSDTSGKFVAYQFVGAAESNVKDKVAVGDVIVRDTATAYIDVKDSLRVYMTGFAPYATTGYTKTEEGVFLFRGSHGAKLDVYLEDCHIFSRNKTINGNTFYGDKEGGETFDEPFARGSGGVLVFENVESVEQLQTVNPFTVNIHTRGNNLLKSNYGCFFILMKAMKAYQISAPIHIHMNSAKHVSTSKTTLNFDDQWPVSMGVNRNIASTKRTNGYLGLKKQSNNAPSIDLGNPHNVVNFRGGQIEMQNAQIVSSNYKTTLAISYRSGEYGDEDLGLKLSYGIGTDSIGGTVNFYDGTITVEPMWVAEAYKQYYLIDTDENGNEITTGSGSNKKYLTSCLRCPKNTYVYGGSICRIRACQHVTSKGGAPKDGPTGKFLGQYTYTLDVSDEVDPETNLVKSIQFPNNIVGLADYHASRSYTYGTKSVMPDANNKLYFWIPDGYGDVSAEVDKLLTPWKACMTEIRAGVSVYEGAIGGDTPIESNEEVNNLLYCKIDENILRIISAKDGAGNYSYSAPVKVPDAAKDYFNGDYTSIPPTYVGDKIEHEVLSDTAYTITDKVYYITTAKADLWHTFTAPFDVAKIYVMETFPEDEYISRGLKKQEVLLEQAKHNADFAAFFGVAMALGTTDSFDQIYDSYITWAKEQDQKRGKDISNYDKLRGKHELIPYTGSNWREAHFYLNHNTADWGLTQLEDSFSVEWSTLPADYMNDGVMLHKGETYSILFPYTSAQDVTSRDYWDYWSGKFIIFESTQGPHIINGSDYLNAEKESNIFSDEPGVDKVKVLGNSTFSMLRTTQSDIYYFDQSIPEGFIPNLDEDENGDYIPVSEDLVISPASSFLWSNVPYTTSLGMIARVGTDGKIYYKQGVGGNPSTGVGNTPTIGGNSSLFITAISDGINVAVDAPQYVRVLTASGHIVYAGFVQENVNVILPVNGIYIVSGEKEAQKIMLNL